MYTVLCRLKHTLGYKPWRAIRLVSLCNHNFLFLCTCTSGYVKITNHGYIVYNMGKVIFTCTMYHNPVNLVTQQSCNTIHNYIVLNCMTEHIPVSVNLTGMTAVLQGSK